MASSAADVLNAAKKRRIDPVTGLEDWGLTLFMRSMTEREKAEYEWSITDPETGRFDPAKVKKSRAILVSKVICDENGTLLFSEDHVRQLMAGDGKLVNVLDDQCRRHVGLKKDEKKADSDSTSDDDSPSD